MRNAHVDLENGGRLTLTDVGSDFVVDLQLPSPSSACGQVLFAWNLRLKLDKEQVRDFLDVLLEEPEEKEESSEVSPMQGSQRTENPSG